MNGVKFVSTNIKQQPKKPIKNSMNNMVSSSKIDL